MRPRSVMVGLIAASLVAAACSGGAAETTTTTVALTTLPPVTTTVATTTTAATTTTTTTEPPTTTTSSSSTTSTTVVALPTSPLNGMPVAEELADNLQRRVLGVKVDNHPDARPQSGLQDADAVYELIVEAGLTRFIALFLQSDTDYIGPIRSLRPTDPVIVRPLEATLQISGGQAWIKGIARSNDVDYIGETDPNTFRIPRNGRAYERTLFGTTEGMRARADRLNYSNEPPPEWFAFGDATPTASRATSITLRWSVQTTVDWEFNTATLAYERFVGDAPHNTVDRDGNEEQITFDTLIVIAARRYTASPSGGQSGSSVPALDTVGSGDLTVFFRGGAISGRWQRSSASEPFQLIASDGTEIVLPPGRIWVSVFPSSGTLSWE